MSPESRIYLDSSEKAEEYIASDPIIQKLIDTSSIRLFHERPSFTRFVANPTTEFVHGFQIPESDIEVSLALRAQGIVHIDVGIFGRVDFPNTFVYRENDGTRYRAQRARHNNLNFKFIA